MALNPVSLVSLSKEERQTQTINAQVGVMCLQAKGHQGLPAPVGAEKASEE